LSQTMEKFLGSVAKKTALNWKRGINLFCEWYGKSVDEILAERKSDLIPKPDQSFVDQKERASRFEKLLEEFHSWLQKPIHTIKGKPNQAYKINSIRTYCMGVLQLFRYYSMPITLRTGSPLSQTTISTGDFPLKPEHVRQMFHSAKDLRSKLMISMANDLGCGIGDFITTRKDELPDLNQQAPIYWERIRGKTKQVIKTCLSETTKVLLKEYLFTFPEENNPYLFHSNGSHVSDVTVNQRLRDLASESGIKLGNKSLHFHLFRKMIISQAKNLGIDPDIIKVMVGKAVPKSLLTYMTDINIIEAFKKLQTVTRINGELIKPEAETMLATMGKALADMDDKINKLQTQMETLNEALRESPYLIMRTETPDGKETYTLIKSEKLDKKAALKYIEGKRKP